MTRIALLLSLIASFALAQPAVTRGGALKKRAYQTYSAMTLYYVDPTGNDANACTASGTSACVTLQGVWDKLPDNIRHTITVNVAAGNYAFSSTLQGRNFGIKTTGQTAAINVVGPALANVVPATGLATGTITSITASPGTSTTITDSSGTWTTNDLRGYFLVMTSGAQVGQATAIIANTGTILTTLQWVAGNPVAGDTFAIQTPSAVITGSQTLSTLRGSGRINFSKLEFISTSVQYAISQNSVDALSGFSTVYPFCRVRNTGTGGAFVSRRSPLPSGTTLGATTLAPMVILGSAQGLASSDTQSQTGLARVMAYATSGAALTILNSPLFYFSSAYFSAETGSSTSAAAIFDVIGPGNFSGLSAVTASFRCPIGSTSPGLTLSGTGVLIWYNVEAVNCGTGVLLGPSSTILTGGPSVQLQVDQLLTCTNTATCFTLARGSRANIRASPTFSGVTNEYNIDGDIYTEAFFGGLSTKRIVGPNLSVLERQ